MLDKTDVLNRLKLVKECLLSVEPLCDMDGGFPDTKSSVVTAISQLNSVIKELKKSWKIKTEPTKPLSNEELNSGWKTTIVDHGKEDSMAGWPHYLDDKKI